LRTPKFSLQGAKEYLFIDHCDDIMTSLQCLNAHTVTLYIQYFSKEYYLGHRSS